MTMKGRGINLQALTECVCYLLFGCLLLQITYSGGYLNYVTPRMKPYLYGMSALMLLWAAMAGRRILIPQYRLRLSRSLVFIIPILLLAIRPAASGGKGMIRSDENSDFSKPSGNEGGQMAWYDLNGLDKAAKTITIADEDYYAWMCELSNSYEAYEGYTIVMKGFVYRDPSIPQGCDFALIRLSMWCCAADLSPIGFLVDSDSEVTCREDDWVTVTGTLGIREDGEALILKAQRIEAAEKPEEEYVYPYVL